MPSLDRAAFTTSPSEPSAQLTEAGKAKTAPADRRVIVQAVKLLGMISRARELNEPLMGFASSTSQHRQFERLIDKFRQESQALRRLKAYSPAARRAQEKALLACIELQNEETSGWSMMQLIPSCGTITL